MEAHEALGRVETMHGSHAHPREGLASVAGVIVAILAAFLAVATFLANEQVKDVITNETRGADLSAQYEVNSVKQTIDENDALLLRTVGTGHPKALAHAEKLETLRAAALAPRTPGCRPRSPPAFPSGPRPIRSTCSMRSRRSRSRSRSCSPASRSWSGAGGCWPAVAWSGWPESAC